MILRAQLLRGQFKRDHHLFCEVSSFFKPERVKHNLANHFVVWHHHCHASKQRLQVVGKLGSPGVTRVHRDENRESRLHLDVGALKLDPRLALGFRAEQLLQLLGNDGQHLDVDSVELVEAGPGASRGQSFEEFSDHDVVHLVRAVENDALFGQGLREILRGLGFPGSGRPCRRAAQIKLERAHEGHVAFIGQRRDDQPEGVSQVLVAVREVCLDAPHEAVVVVDVVTELGDPLEGGNVLDFCSP